MRPRAELSSDSPIPTLRRRALFSAKAAVLRVRRVLVDARQRPQRHRCGSTLADAPVVARSQSELWSAHDPAERALVAGKIQNLRIALRRIDGIEIPAGALFSFWRQLGRATRSAGYVHGRELREGCIVPAIGGGLCQLSNALYDAAASAGLEIVERHRHTRIIPGSLAEQDRDATIFWNYLDLRFRSPVPLRIEASLDAQHLVVTIRAQHSVGEHSTMAPSMAPSIVEEQPLPAPRSCVTCGEDGCSLNARGVRHAQSATATSRTGWLLDEYWPEYQRYVDGHVAPGDTMLQPLAPRVRSSGSYRCATAGVARHYETVFAVRRSIALRRVATQGAGRQQTLIAQQRALAERYDRALPHEVEHLVVMQSMLPELQRLGTLGGRTYDVLMTALPMEHLQARLDAARALHPNSPTLGDFRADDPLVDRERTALAGARTIITPHAEIASLFGERATLIEWELPERPHRALTRATRVCRLLFPCSTLGRKGAYELRDAVRGLPVEIVIAGRELEGERFWEGIATEHGGTSGLDEFDAVVLPAFVEHRPRRLLAAIASGVPVIASSACGIGARVGVTIVPPGDVDALRDAIERTLLAHRVHDHAVSSADRTPTSSERHETP
jgi:hypothetical protein